VKPIALPPNPVERFYEGGSRIARFRGVDGWSATAPEDWVGSATEAFGEPGVGLSVLPGGGPLREAVARDPEPFVGPAHAERFGADLGLLVKLLDAGVRLPVHWHPDRAFARAHLHSCYGKTEAWAILEAEPDAVVYLGWRDGVTAQQLARWHDEQCPDDVLAAMHRVSVRAGDSVLVPAGTPHAIGQGILLLELQEPTDFGVLLEWRGFSDAPTGDLGLGAPVALGSVEASAMSSDRLLDLRRSRPASAAVEAASLFPAEADAYFRAERVRGGGELEAAFTILVVTEGSGSLETNAGDLPVARGDTVLVPWAAGPSRVLGDVEGIRCLPPLEPPPSLPTTPSSSEARA
jgi:mannose-6-phosphate isomerase